MAEEARLFDSTETSNHDPFMRKFALAVSVVSPNDVRLAPRTVRESVGTHTSRVSIRGSFGRNRCGGCHRRRNFPAELHPLAGRSDARVGRANGPGSRPGVGVTEGPPRMAFRKPSPRRRRKLRPGEVLDRPVRLTQVPNVPLADMMCSQLRANGIEAYYRGISPFGGDAVGIADLNPALPAEIMVGEHQLDQARRLLNAT
jgi:hypothetical protein